MPSTTVFSSSRQPALRPLPRLLHISLLGLAAGVALPAQAADAAAAAMPLLAVVITLGATAVGVLMRTRGSPAYILGVAGLGGVGVTVATLVLGLRHVMPNLPGVRENHTLWGLIGVGAVALLTLGLGVRGLIAAIDAFRVQPRRGLVGGVLLVVSLALVAGAGLGFYALGSGKLALLTSYSSSLGAGPNPPASE